MVCSEADGISSPTTIFTQKVGSVPSGMDLPSASRQFKIACIRAISDGATRSTETSTVELTSVSGTGTESGALHFVAGDERDGVTGPCAGAGVLKFPGLGELLPGCPGACYQGTVTSSTKTAPSLQDGVGVGVNGSGVGEVVGGISVGTVKFSPVGGRVEVTKRTGAFVGASPETLTQETTGS